MTLLRTMEALSRAANLQCGCQPYTDVTLCRCGGSCACHRPGGALYMGPGEDFTPREYLQVPPALILGEGVLRVVRCHLCGSRLTPNAARPVYHEGPQRWRHGGAAEEDCRTGARVARGGRTLERLLRKSVTGRKEKV